MNTEMFVEAIKRHVCSAAVEDMLEKLRNPPGRRVPVEIKERSSWYLNLSEADAKIIEHIVVSAVNEAVFGLFAILDGSRVIEDGRFELVHVNEERILLNDPDKIGLNEIFNAAD